jgi:hypothetical protein
MRNLVLLLCLSLLALAGCSSTIGFGDDDGVGLRSSIGKEGKIFVVEGTDGNGQPTREATAQASSVP